MKKVLLVCVLLTGCGPALPSTSFVDKLRVLAVQAEPPEISPGDSTALTLLAVEPFVPGAEVNPPATPSPITALWLACPESAAALASSDFMPCGFSTGPMTTSLPPSCSDQPDAPLCLAGTGSQLSYTAPVDALAGADTATILFTVAVADTADGALGCLMSAAATGAPTNPDHCIVALKELTVSNPATHPESRRNHNPQLIGLRLELKDSGDDGGTIAPDGGVAETSPVDLVAGTGTVPLRTKNSPALQLATTRAATAAEVESDGSFEVLTLSWYTTAGSFDDSRSVFIPPGCGDPTLCPTQSPAPTTTTPYDAPTVAQLPQWVDQSDRVDFWAVVRDDRGGVGWLSGSARTP